MKSELCLVLTEMGRHQVQDKPWDYIAVDLDRVVT